MELPGCCRSWIPGPHASAHLAIDTEQKSSDLTFHNGSNVNVIAFESRNIRFSLGGFFSGEEMIEIVHKDNERSSFLNQQKIFSSSETIEQLTMVSIL